MELRESSLEFASFKKGEIEGYNYFRRLYSDQLYEWVLGWVKRTDEARDIVSEVFITLWESTQKIGDEDHLHRFLFTTSVNLVLNSLRHQRMRSLTSAAWANMREQEGEGMPEREKMEDLMKLAEAIDKLPSRRKLMLKLRFLSGWTSRKIADSLGVSSQTVRNTTNDAKKQLAGKKKIKRHGLPT